MARSMLCVLLAMLCTFQPAAPIAARAFIGRPYHCMAFTRNRNSVSLRTTASSCLPPRYRVILSAQLENRDGHPDEIQKGDKLPSAFDAQHTFWKALLALMWPLILVWRMVLATVRTLDEAAVIAQHIHAHQSTQYLPSPSSKGNNSLDWDLLRQQIQLSAAMNREDYDAALKIKAAIMALQSRRTNDLATQLLHMSSKMRKDIKDIRAAQNESNFSSLQRLIQDAVEEQDFARAARLHKQLLELAPPPPPPPRADLEYLEWDTKKRVAQALANEKLLRQDPINDLTAHLAELLLEEDFRQAAKVHAQLRRLQNDRDMQALMHKLDEALSKRREMEMEEKRHVEGVKQEIERIRLQNSVVEARAKEKLKSMHGEGQGDALVQNSIVDFSMVDHLKPLFMSFDFENKRDGTSTLDLEC